MESSGYLHTGYRFYPEERCATVHRIGGLNDPSGLSETVRERTDFFHLPAIDRELVGWPARILARVPNEISRLASPYLSACTEWN